MTTTEEQLRIQELLELEIMDTPEEQGFNEVVELASQICETEISLISLLDDKRQWFKAKVGLDASETPIEYAFCAHALEEKDTFIVNHADKDPRFENNPLVQGNPDIRYYAGQPLRGPKGNYIGTLCVIHNEPKSLNEFQLNALRTLAKQVEYQLALRLRARDAEERLGQLRDQRKEMEQLLDIQSRTLSVLSHDLRSPLASLSYVMDVFENEMLTAEEALEFIRQLKTSVTNLSYQVDTILTWARDQVSKPTTHVGVVDLHQTGMRLMDWFGIQSSQKGVQLELDCPAEAQVRTDEGALHVVLRNLIGNSLKFSPEGTTISLRIEEQGDQWHVRVKDQGIGMTADQLKRAMNPEQLYTTQGTSQEKGTGLGLTLVQNYLERLGSKLHVESAQGQGSEFSFFLSNL